MKARIYFFFNSFVLPLMFEFFSINPDWMNTFSEQQRRILDQWNGIQNIKIKLVLLHLASPFLHFDEKDFVVYLTEKQRVCATLNLIFIGLFAFFGSLVLYSAAVSGERDGIGFLISFSFVLFLSAAGLFFSYTDKYAALYLQKKLNK